jgi:hypothetical protein
MNTSLYSVTTPVFIKSLTQLKAIVEKAQAHFKEKGIDDASVLQASLAPDQFPFVKQVQIACDNAKASSFRLSGTTPPSFADTEATFPELIARIDATIEILKGVKREDVDGKEDAKVTQRWFPEGTFVSGFSYVTELLLPNFFFHYVTAYAILRHLGLEVGKQDYIGEMSMQSEA